MKNKILLLSLLFFNSYYMWPAVPPEMPHQRATYIHSPFYFEFSNSGENELINIENNHGYTIMDNIDYTLSTNPQATITKFLNGVNSGNYGIIFESAHGLDSDGYLIFEVYSLDGVNNFYIALNNYWSIYNTDEINGGLLVDSETGDPKYYGIWITNKFIQNYIKITKHPIVFLGSCNSYKVAPNFRGSGAESVFAYTTEVTPLLNKWQYTRVLSFMGGEGFWGLSKRNYSVQEAYDNFSVQWIDFHNNMALYTGNPTQKLYTSPRIIKLKVEQDKDTTPGWDTVIYDYLYSNTYPYINGDYPGNLSNAQKGIGQKVPTKISIQFSKEIDKNNFEVKLIPSVGGTSQVINGNFSTTNFTDDTWIWGGTPNMEGQITISVNARDTYLDDQNDVLDTNGDGNSDGEDILHKFTIARPSVSFFGSAPKGIVNSSKPEIKTNIKTSGGIEIDEDSVTIELKKEGTDTVVPLSAPVVTVTSNKKYGYVKTQPVAELEDGVYIASITATAKGADDTLVSGTTTWSFTIPPFDKPA